MNTVKIDHQLKSGSLRQIDPKNIFPNPENPRIIFRTEEMEKLLVSIDQHGIQVPITVYKEGNSYYLIDGERRWRCALKLDLKTIPAIVEEKPSELENLVLMYNIHALREQWDYFTIASKLKRVIDLFKAENHYEPNERELSRLTGLTVGAIRRCQLMIRLPDQYKELLMHELEKPKAQQQISEDFLIEMERALRAVVRRIPEYVLHLNDIRDVLIQKFRDDTIRAVTDFRQLSKIATAIDRLGLAQRTAKRALDRVFDPNERFGIRQAYAQTVEFEYFERKAARDVEHLMEFLDSVLDDEKADELEEEVLDDLRELADRIAKILAQAEGE